MIQTVLVLPTPLALLALRRSTTRWPSCGRRAEPRRSTLPAGRTRVVVLAAPVSEANWPAGSPSRSGHRVARHLLAGRQFEPQLALPYAAAALLRAERPRRHWW